MAILLILTFISFVGVVIIVYWCVEQAAFCGGTLRNATGTKEARRPAQLDLTYIYIHLRKRDRKDGLPFPSERHPTLLHSIGVRELSRVAFSNNE